jgi:hypothetical protein
MLNEIIEYALQHPEGKILFDTPVTVENICVIRGAWAGKGALYLMDGSRLWTKIETTDQNAELVLNSIYQRISLMKYDQSRVPSYADAYGSAI